MNLQNSSFFDSITWIEPYQTENKLKIQELCMRFEAKSLEYRFATSGSTGPQKDINLTYSQLQESAWNTIQVFKINPSSSWLLALPIHTVGGAMVLVRSILGGLHLIAATPSACPLANLPFDQNFDYISLSPHQFLFMLKQNESSKYLKLLLNTKGVFLGGGSLSAEVTEQICIHKVPVIHTYGMTETASHVAYRYIKPDNPDPDFSLMPNLELKQNSLGCICINGSVTNNIWLETNDLCQLTSPTTFRIIGRLDNVINSGGVKIQLERVESIVEECLMNLGISNRFFIDFIPDALLGQKVVLFIEDKTPLQDGVWNYLQNAIEKNYSKYAIPKIQIAIAEFSETSTYKLDRVQTKKRAYPEE